MKEELCTDLSETARPDVPVETLSDTDELYAAGLCSLDAVRVLPAVEDDLSIAHAPLVSKNFMACE